jgi:hypothetical protein
VAAAPGVDLKLDTDTPVFCAAPASALSKQTINSALRFAARDKRRCAADKCPSGDKAASQPDKFVFFISLIYFIEFIYCIYFIYFIGAERHKKARIQFILN